MPVPAGADALKGVAKLYERYDTTKAAKEDNPTRKTIDAFAAAQQALADERQRWREIREWAAAEASAIAAADQAAAAKRDGEG